MKIFLLFLFLLSPFGFAQSVNQQIISSQKSVWKLDINDYQGTAFAIQPNLLVTNAHGMYLLLERESIKDIVLSQTSDGPKLKVKRLVSVSALYDIAIFETEQQVEHLSFAHEKLLSDQNLSIIGYPDNEFKVMKKMSLIFHEDQFSYSFLVNHFDLHGASGSPVLNKQGRLVGLAFSASFNMLLMIKVEHLKALLREEIGTSCKSANYKRCIQEEIKALQQKSESGNLLAQHRLAFMYQSGQGVVADLKKAFDLFTKIVNSDQNFVAQHKLAMMYKFGEGTTLDYKQAFLLLTEAADLGYVLAKHPLAIMYYNGEGTTQDYKQAFLLFKEMSNLGYAVAKYLLAVMYYKGEGTTQDYKQAFLLLKEVADLGFAVAQYQLAKMYYYGEGTPQDLDKASSLSLELGIPDFL